MTEVVVLGAGPAGAAIAHALCRRGVRVRVLDRARRARFAIGESAAPQLASLLAGLGLPTALDELGHRPYHGNVSLWGGPAIVDDFARRGAGHGWHLDRAAFDGWLRDTAVAAGATVEAMRGLAGVERGERGWRVHVRRGDRVESIGAAVIVDATGRAAALGRRVGARVRRVDQLIAIAVEAAPGDGAWPGRSLIEPFADGWWYAAGLPSGRVMVMLMTDADLAREARLGERASFRRAFEATQAIAAAAQIVWDPPPVLRVVPAHTQFLDCAAGPGWIAAGDALLALDPLTASGIVGAIDDACAAADTVAAWLAARDPGQVVAAGRAYAERAAQTLRRYLAERRAWYAREPRWAERAFWRRRA
jgi:flavin-dependent dehydrogenase